MEERHPHLSRRVGEFLPADPGGTALRRPRSGGAVSGPRYRPAAKRRHCDPPRGGSFSGGGSVGGLVLVLVTGAVRLSECPVLLYCCIALLSWGWFILPLWISSSSSSSTSSSGRPSERYLLALTSLHSVATAGLDEGRQHLCLYPGYFLARSSCCLLHTPPYGMSNGQNPQLRIREDKYTAKPCRVCFVFFPGLPRGCGGHARRGHHIPVVRRLRRDEFVSTYTIALLWVRLSIDRAIQVITQRSAHRIKTRRRMRAKLHQWLAMYCTWLNETRRRCLFVES